MTESVIGNTADDRYDIPQFTSAQERSMTPMKKFLFSTVKFITVAILITVIIGGIAIKTISDLACEYFELREQITELENRVQEEKLMTCSLHVSLLPSWNIKFLTYKIPMQFPTTWEYFNSYRTGEVVPILQFEDSYFLSLYVTAEHRLDSQ